jgi:copper homeostasis protein
MPVRVEVCVSTFDEARAALDTGADAIEVCSCLPCGGLTPSLSFVRRLARLHPPRMRVLVRPRPGGFVYTDEEARCAADDALMLTQEAARFGLVVGDLEEERIHGGQAWKALMTAAPEREFTFHRAIDHAADMLQVLESCMSLGFHRVLTSGGASLAIDGARRIRQMVELAQGRIAIAAAGGVNPGNVVGIVERTGVEEVHFAAQRPKTRMAVLASMSSAHSTADLDTEPDRAKIEGVLNALVKAGLR